MSNQWLHHTTESRPETHVHGHQLQLFRHVAWLPKVDPAHQVMPVRDNSEWKRPREDPVSSRSMCSAASYSGWEGVGKETCSAHLWEGNVSLLNVNKGTNSLIFSQTLLLWATKLATPFPLAQIMSPKYKNSTLKGFLIKGNVLTSSPHTTSWVAHSKFVILRRLSLIPLPYTSHQFHSCCPVHSCSRHLFVTWPH